MDKNLFLAIALSIAVYAVWFGWVEKRLAPPRGPVSAAGSATSAAPERPAPSAASGMQPPGKAAAIAPSLAGAVAPTAGPAHVFATPSARIAFSSLGAAIASFKFQGPLGLVELVPQPGPGFFASSQEPFELESADDSSVAFRGNLAGARLRKIYRWAGNGDWNELILEVFNPGRAPLAVAPLTISLGPGLGTVESEVKENPSQWRVVAHDPKKKRAVKVKPGKDAGEWDWIGVDNRYFVAAVLRGPNGLRAEASDKALGSDKAPALLLSTEPLSLAPGEKVRLSLPFYFGPKDYGRLKSLGHGLEDSVDFGFFGWLGKPIFFSLKSLRRLTGNYGWAILILTLSIQTLLFPLSYKSLKANAAMKKLQPQIQRIQERFKSDPKRMNVEMMQLYKASGTNPLGGCLPMLAQIPVFFALFTALRNAWELHGAPWIGWIKDLSSHDPYYILPLIMGGLMFVQQKAGPQVGDPAQAKMMQFMPILFTFMFLNFPSGLVLYWLTNSLVSLATQASLQNRL